MAIDKEYTESNPGKVQFSVQLDKELAKRLDQRARKNVRSRNAEINLILREALRQK